MHIAEELWNYLSKKKKKKKKISILSEIKVYLSHFHLLARNELMPPKYDISDSVINLLLLLLLLQHLELVGKT